MNPNWSCGLDIASPSGDSRGLEYSSRGRFKSLRTRRVASSRFPAMTSFIGTSCGKQAPAIGPNGVAIGSGGIGNDFCIGFDGQFDQSDNHRVSG